jgi:putative transposase
MTRPSPFRYFKTSPEIIRLAVMMYVRFPLSLRNVEDLLHERGIEISYETVRFWWNRSGPMFAAEIRRRREDRMRAGPQWRWHVDEVFVKINGERHYLWWAVDQDGDVIEILVQRKRNARAAKRFFLAEVSHQPTRQRERQMRRFKSAGQAQRFLSVHGVILNFFRFSRHRMSSKNYRRLRARAFKDWNAATAA